MRYKCQTSDQKAPSQPNVLEDLVPDCQEKRRTSDEIESMVGNYMYGKELTGEIFCSTDLAFRGRCGSE